MLARLDCAQILAAGLRVRSFTGAAELDYDRADPLGSPDDQPGRHPLNADTPASRRKAQLDALLLKLPGVSAKTISGLDAYFVSDRMFACISGNGVGLRLPAATASELQFSRENVVAFQPRGVATTREWIQIDRADAADYEKDLPLFQASVEFVRTGRAR
jgi:hypothetical protein